MMTLEDIQKIFLNATEKEHWERLKTLLCSEDKESVVQGMSFIEQLDEKVYYDGVCTFLEDDGSGKWRLKDGLGCENELALQVEVFESQRKMLDTRSKRLLKMVFWKICLLESVEK